MLENLKRFIRRLEKIRQSFIWIILILILLTLPGGTKAEKLTIERFTSLPTLTGTEPANPVWSPNSKYMAFLWNNKAMPSRDMWIVPAISGEAKQITDMARDFPNPEKTPSDPYAALVQKVSARMRGGVSEVIWTPDSKALIFSYRGDLFKIQADGTELEQLTEKEKSKYSFSFSPDGKILSYLQEGDLWLWNQETKAKVQATKYAAPAIGNVPGGRYSRLDAEVASYKWSPDSKSIAIYFFDRRNVRKLLFPNYLTEEVSVQMLRRDYTGDRDFIREMGIYSVGEAKLEMLNLEGKVDRHVNTYAWSPDGSKLLIDQHTETQIDRWIYVMNIIDDTLTEIWHDSRESRLIALWNSQWQSDGKGIFFLTDVDGYNHLYALPLAKGQGKPKQLTKGEWEILGLRGPGDSTLTVSPKTKEIFFTSTQKNPYERQVYKMAEKGGPITQLTTLAGSHLPYLSPDASKIALIHSNDVTPIELYIIDTKAKSPERRITDSPPKEFYEYKWIEPRYVTFESHIDGVTLHGRLLEPPNLDKSKKYPVIIGPVYSDTARNQWNGTYGTLQQYLALEGQYIGLHIDIRGSSGYGVAFRDRFKFDVTGIDLDDLHSGVKYLTTLPYVDPQRIGIWGSSYGGLLTVNSLFKKPGIYKAGVAGAPATNIWHATVSEKRLFGMPDKYPEYYRKGSAFYFGEGLQDHLMIIHGMWDDVVLFRDSIFLAEKLMMLGKDFDLVIAPSAVHGWSQKDYVALYLLKKLVGHFDRYLGRGAR